MSRREWCASRCSWSLLSSYITTVVKARYSYHASGRSVWRFLQAMAAHRCDVELALGSKFEGHVRPYMCLYARLADYWGPQTIPRLLDEAFDPSCWCVVWQLGTLFIGRVARTDHTVSRFSSSCHFLQLENSSGTTGLKTNNVYRTLVTLKNQQLPIFSGLWDTALPICYIVRANTCVNNLLRTCEIGDVGMIHTIPLFTYIARFLLISRTLELLFRAIAWVHVDAVLFSLWDSRAFLYDSVCRMWYTVCSTYLRQSGFMWRFEVWKQVLLAVEQMILKQSFRQALRTMGGCCSVFITSCSPMVFWEDAECPDCVVREQTLSQLWSKCLVLEEYVRSLMGDCWFAAGTRYYYLGSRAWFW